MVQERCEYELAVEKYFGLSDSIKENDRVVVDFGTLVDFAQLCSNSLKHQSTEIKRYQIDYVKGDLVLLDENGETVFETSVDCNRITFNGTISDLRAEHQR